MHLVLTVVDPSGTAAAVDVVVDAAPATPLRDVRRPLLEAVGRTEGSLFAGAQALEDSAPLGSSPLLDGAVLTVGRPGAGRRPALLELQVVAGPDSGTVHPMPPGEHAVGRALEAAVRVDDPDVSRLHAVLRVGTDGGDGTTVHDLGSTNGTTVDEQPVRPGGRAVLPGQVLRFGATRAVLAVPDPVPVTWRPDGAGHLAVNRPPRHLPAQEPVCLVRPAEPPAAEPARFPVVAVLLPLLAGAVLLLATRSPGYLALVLLSPVMALGGYWGDRSRVRRAARTARAAHAAAAARVEQAVRQAVAEESAARARAHPGPASLLLTATGPDPRLWERRPSDDDALVLRLGLGTVTSAVQVRATGGRSDHTDRPRLTDVPVTIGLADAGVVGLAGPRRRMLPVARTLLAELACWHSPHWLTLVLLAPGRAPDWAWARWLPHLRAAPDGGRLLVGLDDLQLRGRIAELTDVLDARSASTTSVGRPWTGPATVVLLDGAGALRRRPGVARLLEDGPAVGLRFVCLEQDLVSLPVECRATAEAAGPTGTRLRVIAGGSTYDDVVADGVGDRWAHRFARALAPLRDATPEGRGSALPSQVRLLDLLPLDATDPAALEASWRAGARGTRVLLGCAGAGEPVTVDLAADGPHALVAGTTGAGKSELLQTLVAGLAVANRPDEMAFVLIDYKGGAAFQDCSLLPHTVGVVTDLDGHLTERALRSLGAELRRRERLLRTAGCKDLDDYQARAPSGSPRLARLVLVVDEFATLAEELPGFVGGLVGIAQRGRSLGLHLVLATQRPGGVVSSDIRANTSLRIALRVVDPTESTDVVDVGDAAAISRAHPGRAVLRAGRSDPRLVQTARVGGRPAAGGVARVSVAVWERAGDQEAASPPEGLDGPTDLVRLVAAARSAAARLGVPPVASPWLPPLPGLVTLADVAGVAGVDGTDGVPIGLLDLPAEQRRTPLVFRTAGGDHLLVAGGPRSGRSTLLRTLAAALATAHDPGDLHLFGLDGGGLGPLDLLPHCGAVVARDEPARADRLLARLVEEGERRRQLLAAAGLSSVEEQRTQAAPGDRLPWLVLMVDGWEALSTAYAEVEHGRPLDSLLRLLREGAALGVRVVLTGDRGLLGSRTAAAFRDRWVLRLADPADHALAGIALRDVPAQRPPGRALLAPDAVEAQLAVLAPDPSGAAQLEAFERVAADARSRSTRPGAAVGPHPMRVEPLPARVDLDEIAVPAKETATGPGWLLVGVGGDLAAPLGVDLDVDGPAFVVAGPHGSGRTTALATMGRWLLRQGRPVVVVAHRRSPLLDLTGEPGVLAAVGPGDAPALERWLRTCPDVAVLADDAETLHDAPVERPLIGLLRADADGAAALLLAGSAAEMAGCFRGLTVEARKARTGLLLGPASPADGDLFGVRVTADRGAAPGRGLLVVRGRGTPVQVATSG